MRNHNWARALKRRYIILVSIVAALVLLGFPTPHSRTVEDLVKELDCSRILEDGESLQESWTNMKDQTRIVVDIQSTEDVEVRLAGITSITQSNPEEFYHTTDSIHNIAFTRNDAMVEIHLLNPCWYAEYVPPSWLGPSAFMNGSIQAYHVYQIQEWLPWWVP